jgi:uncharacterized protein
MNGLTVLHDGAQFTVRTAGRVLVFLVVAYQKIISPILPSSCIYTPSCSQYAIDAIRRHGPWKGGLMALMRLVRCTPFHRGGFDPVREVRGKNSA